MKDSIKAVALCVLAFLLGCVVVSMGCATTATIGVEFCEDCDFVPWTDSWCEYHEDKSYELGVMDSP